MAVSRKDPPRSRRIPDSYRHLAGISRLWDGARPDRKLESRRPAVDSARGRPESGSTGSAVGVISAGSLGEEVG